MPPHSSATREHAALQYISTMAGSALAGMLARIPCHPLDTVKARLQVQTSTNKLGYRNAMHALKTMIQQEGWRSLYRGFGITFFGSGPGTMLYFTAYEYSKRTLTSSASPFSSLPFLAHFCSGIAAECVSCLFFVPIDVIKERMQVQRPKGVVYYRDTMDAVRKIMSTEGIVGIYRGYGATIASFGPFSALYFVLYEHLKSYAHRMTSVPASESLPLSLQIATACTAGAVSSLLTNPLDIAKLRLQVQRSLKHQQKLPGAAEAEGLGFHYRNTAHALGEIVRNEGFAALFRGAGARMAFHAPSTAITMTLFERCRDLVSTVVDR